MKKKVVWLVVSCVMALSLVVASCGPAEEEAEVEVGEEEVEVGEEEVGVVEEEEEVVQPTEEVPKYGGTLSLASGMGISQWDPTRIITGTVPGLYLNSLWEGDWSRGPAGGYGTGETDWGFTNNDIFDLKMGMIAESWEWTIDAETQEGKIVYQIRDNVHWALDPDKEASRLVNGRKVTADDVVFTAGVIQRFRLPRYYRSWS